MEAPPAVAAVAAAPGWAPIKKEFLLAKRKREEAPASLGDQEKASSNNDAAAPKPDAVVVPPAAAAVPKAKSKRQRKKERKEKIKVCDAMLINGSCPNGDKCKMLHDVAAFLASKPPDLLPSCPLFEKYGKCPFSIKCRFGGHIVDGKNIEQPPLLPRVEPKNTISKDLQGSLWRSTREFPKSIPVIAEWEKTKGNPPDSTLSMRPHPREVKKLDVKGKLILAPLTTIGNLPYRVICKGLGADITIGEMAVATHLLQGQRSEWALTKRDPCEDVFGIQVAGAHVDSMTKCAELLNDELSFDFLDINCGCPIDIVYNKGMGSALLERVSRLEAIARSVHSVLDKPMTIKIRTGRDEKNPSVHRNIVPFVHQWGASALTIHGRSREQRYSRNADWSYVGQCVQLAQLPVIGNGDVYSWQEAEDHIASTGVSALMLARGAIIKPWLFTEIKERRDWDISATERLDIIKKFCHLGLDHWGSDDHGVDHTRSFLLNWQSFLHRYVPVGLLERLPSKISDRPVPFYGRSDLETLLASGDTKDWIRISEMFLGKVPDGFTFTPKHKSATYSEDASSSNAAAAANDDVEG